MSLRNPIGDRTKRALVYLQTLALIFTSSHPVLIANPSGATVVYGNAVFNDNGPELTVQQNGQQLIIDWQDFSIDAGEVTRFVQPSTTASALNRVVSGNLSEIYGQLDANGEIFLINPNGVIIGESAQIDAASFTASTLDIENTDFLDGGNRTFRATGTVSGHIINMGRIEAISGDITLISEVITQSGELIASQGSVDLAAGREVIVQPDSDKRIFISLPSDEASIDNTGSIEAARAEIVAAHSNPYALAINQDGVVRATGTQAVNGEIWLVADGGTVAMTGQLDASNADSSGGDILVTGSQTGIYDGAQIRADGDGADGGQVLIGGSRRGTDDSIFHSDRTYIAEGAQVSVDASGADSTAGTLIAWGNETLRSFGQLSARGAGYASGGFIETSAGWFDLGSSVADVSSDFGQSGEWLIDPYNIVINDGGLDEFGDTTNPFDNPNTDDAQIDVDTLIAALTSGSGVTVTVETGASGSQDGDITFAADLDYNGIGTGDTLWLRAANDILFNAGIAITDSSGADDSLNLVFQSDSDGSGAGAISTNGATTLFTQGGEIIFSGGNYSTLDDLRTLGMAQGNPSRTNGIYIHEARFDTSGGNVTLRGNGTTQHGVKLDNDSYIHTGSGNITLYGISSSGNGDKGVTLEGVTITANGGDLNFTGFGLSNNNNQDKFAHGVDIADGSSITLTGDSTFTITGTSSQASNDDQNYGVNVSGSGTTISIENGNLAITGTGGLDVGGYGIYLGDGASIQSTGTGDISLTGTSNGTSEGIYSSHTSAFTLGGASMTGDIFLSAGTTGGSDSILLDSDLNIQTSGSITLQSETASDTIGLGDSATGTLNLDATELSTLADGAATIIFGRTDGTGSIDVEALTFTDDVLIQSDTGIIDFDGAFSVGSNDLGLDTDGAITQTGAITAAGIVITGSGDHFLENASNDADTIAGSGGNLAFADTDDLSIGSVTINGTTTNGINVGANNLALATEGALTQTQAIIAFGLGLRGSGTKTLTNSSNDVDELGAFGGVLEYVDADDLTIARTTVNSTLHDALEVVGDVTITAGDDLIFSNDSNFDGNGSGNTWWFRAYEDINLNANDSISDGSGSDDSITVVFQSDYNNSGTGGINLSSDSLISTNGGEVIMSGGNGSTLADLRTSGFARTGANNSGRGFRTAGGDIDAGTGNITIRGQGDTNDGIFINSGSSISTTTGSITIVGDSNSDNDNGIDIAGASTITSSGGIVSITGTTTSDNSGGNQTAHGIEIFGGSTINLTGTATLSIDGTGSQQVNDDRNYGIYLYGTGTGISVENGDMAITGTGGVNTESYGIYLGEDISIASTGTGNITLTGTSTAEAGIYSETTAAYTLGGASMSGDITLIANTTSAGDSIVIDSDLTLQTSSNIIFQSGVASDTMGLGDTSTGLFNLDTTELGTIADGAATIIFGRTDGSGNIDVETLTFTDDVLLQSNTGTIDFDGAISVGTNDLGLDSDGAITQTGAITAGGLVISGSGDHFLENSSNDVDTLAATGGNLSFVDSDGFNIGSVTINSATTNGIDVGSNDLSLDSDGAITQSSAITAGGLVILGSGDHFLENTSNDVDTIAGSGGNLAFADTDDLVIGSVTVNSTTTNGINVGANDVAFDTAGALTQTQAIIGDELGLRGNGTKTLTNSSNNVVEIGAIEGSINYFDTDDLLIGHTTINTTTHNALEVIGDVTITSGAELQLGNDSDFDGNGSGNTWWFRAHEDIQFNSGDVISDETGSDDSINVYLQSDYDNSGTGGINFAGGAGITTNGGEIILSGGNGATAADLRTTGFARQGSNNSGRGIRMSGATLDSGAGNITVRGLGGTGSGIRLLSGADISSTTGSITIVGDSDSTNDNGISMDSSASISSAGGAVSLTGTTDSENTGGTKTANGISISEGTTIILTGASTLTLDGTASQQVNDTRNYGIYLNGTLGAVTLSVENGDMTINGVGGVNSEGYGVYIGEGSTVASTGTGNISITGTSTTDAGIYSESTTAVSIGGASTSGDITFTANTTSAGDSIILDSDITIQTSGNVAFQSGVASDTMGLGDSATGLFNLDATELGTIADGAANIIFGRSDGSGAIDIEALTFTDDVLIQSDSGTIDIDGALSVGTNDLAISSNASLTQSAAITAAGLQLSGSGTKILTDASNGLDTLAATGGELSLTDLDDLIIGSVTVNGTTLNGINLDASQGLHLETAGAATQTQAITATNLILSGTGSKTLTNTSNDIDDLAAYGGSVEFSDTDEITVNSVTVNGTTVTGLVLTGDSIIDALGGDLRMSADSNYNGTGAGNTLWLRASDDIPFDANVNIYDSAGSTESLSVYLQSDSDGSGDGNIDLDTGSSIESNGGEIILSGGNYATLADLRSLGSAQGGVGALGVQVNGTLNSETGNITARGTGGTGAGVWLNGATVDSTTGDITIYGTASNNSTGIFLSNAASVTSDGGAVSITGIGDSDNLGGSTSAHGFSIYDASTITLTGDSTLDISGTASQQLNDTNNIGVRISDTGTALSVENGDMTITGTGGYSTVGYGIFFSSEASIRSTGTGDVYLDGVSSGDERGIWTNSSTTLTLGDASMTSDIYLTSSTTSGTDAIRIDSDLTIDTSGTVYLRPGDTTTTIGLGPSATGIFSLNAGGLGVIDDGVTAIVIGRTDSTASMDLRALTLTDDIVLQSGSGSINFASSFNVGTNYLTINSGGAVTQSGAITAAGLQVLGSGTKTLDHASNAIDEVAGSGGALELYNSGALDLGEVTVNGVTSTGLSISGDTLLTAAGGDLDITEDSDYNGTGAGNTMWLRASEVIRFNTAKDIRDSSGSGDSINLVFQSDYDGDGEGSFDTNGVTNINTQGGEIIVSGGSGATLNDLRTTGSAQGLSGDAWGVYMNDARIYTEGGDITIRGNGSVQDGVKLNDGSILDSGSGSITIYGTTDGADDTGVEFEGVTINSSGGDVSITGFGESNNNNTDRFANGVSFKDGTTVNLTGNSTLTVNGTASQQALDDQNYGIEISGTGTSLSVENGDMSLTGTGGLDVGGYGIYFGDGAAITSTGSGNINLSGTSNGASEGIFTDSSSTFTLGGSSTNSNITLSTATTGGADSILLDSDLTIQTSGILTFQSTSTTDTMGLGDSATGILNLDSTELGTIADGTSSIVFGRNDGTADIDIAALTFTDNVVIQIDSGNIDFGGTFNLGSNNLEINTSGSVTQSAAINTGTLTLGGNGTFTLSNTSNTIDSLGNVSRGGALSLYDSAGGLNISGTIAGTTNNAVTIRTVGDLTLDSGASITTTGSGNNITLEAASGAFINNAGSSALSTDSRFIIYSQNAESPHNKGGLIGSEQYETDYGSDPIATGNVFYYSDTEPVEEAPEENSEEPESPGDSEGSDENETPTEDDVSNEPENPSNDEAPSEEETPSENEDQPGDNLSNNNNSTDQEEPSTGENSSPSTQEEVTPDETPNTSESIIQLQEVETFISEAFFQNNQKTSLSPAQPLSDTPSDTPENEEDSIDPKSNTPRETTLSAPSPSTPEASPVSSSKNPAENKTYFEDRLDIEILEVSANEEILYPIDENLKKKEKEEER
ncbi:MAG: filamentous hemagglutinin N-terminal domain-containing protein [Opitutales bacterium]